MLQPSVVSAWGQAAVCHSRAQAAGVPPIATAYSHASEERQWSLLKSPTVRTAAFSDCFQLHRASQP